MARKMSPLGGTAGKKDSKKKSQRATDVERQMKIQKALYEIADAASAVTDMRSFYKRLHEIVGTLMYAGNFFIATYDEQSGLLNFPYFVDEVDPAPLTQPLANFHGMTSWIIRTGYMGKRGWDQSKELMARGEIEMVGTPNEDGMLAPLKVDDKVIGVVTVQSYTKGIEYTDEDEQVLEFVAQHIAIALTRAHAIEETRQRNSELAILNSVGEAMARTLDVKTVARIVGDKVRDIFSADQIGILLYEQQTNLMHLIYGYDKAHDRYVDGIQVKPIPLGKGLTSKVIESRQPLLLSTREEQDVHGHYLPPELKGQIKPSESWLGVPIMVNEMVLGVVLVEDYRPHVYNENHLHLLQTLSSNMGVAIQNARLFDEIQKRNQEITEALEQQTATSEILSVIANSPTDVQPVFNAIVERATLLCGGGAGFAYRVVDNQIHLAAQYHQDPNAFQEVMSQFPTPLDTPESESNIASVIRNCAILHIADMKTDPRLTQWNRDIAVKYKVGTTLWMPLVRDDKGIGGIFIARDAVDPFTEKQIALVKTFADQAVIAIENVRLFTETQRLLKETEERNAELAIINSVQEGLASKLDIQGIYDLVGDKIREIFDAQGVIITEFDHAVEMIIYNYYIKDQRYYPDPKPFTGLVRELIEKRQTILINQDADGQAEQYSMHHIGGQGAKSMVFVPLLIGNSTTGYIGLHNLERENAFSDSDVRLLETLANSMSVALENARLFDETQRLLKETEDRAAELAVINSVQEGLASKLEMQAIYDLVGDKIMEIFNADVVGIGFYVHALKALDHPYVVDHGERFFPPPMPVPDEMVEYLKSHDATLINTYQEAQALMERFGIHNIGGPTPDNSYIVVPLTISGEFMGRITVAKLPAYAFNQSDVLLLQTLVNSMSVALENARLWEQEKMYRKALQRELEIGREIQAGFLPEALPLVEGWEIAASLMSAREVAGDFYDAFEFPDGTIGLVIADVCDKGVGAALFMTLFRSLIRATSNLEYFEHTENVNSPHSIVERLKRAMSLTNNYIAETHGDSGMFATLFFGILDPRNGKLTYINGGHEPPLIVQSGGVRESLNKTGPAVGAIPDPCFEALETQLRPGDIFFAFTDGAPEAKDPHGEFYSRERLLDILRQDSGSSHELVKIIETELHRYIDSATQFDDITLLAVKRV